MRRLYYSRYFPWLSKKKTLLLLIACSCCSELDSKLVSLVCATFLTIKSFGHTAGKMLGNKFVVIYPYSQPQCDYFNLCKRFLGKVDGIEEGD